MTIYRQEITADIQETPANIGAIRNDHRANAVRSGEMTANSKFPNKTA
jgi:hypothetical protein